MDCRPTNLECCWSCWGSYEGNRLTIIRFHCVLKKWDISRCMRCTTWLLPIPPGSLRKTIYSFLVFSVSYCIYIVPAPCSIVHYYMALICVLVTYMYAIVLKIHILPFCCFAYNIHNLSLVFLVLSWLTASMVSSFSCCSFCNV